MDTEAITMMGGTFALAAATIRFAVWAFDRYDKRRHERLMHELEARARARWGPSLRPPMSSSSSPSRSRSSPAPADVGELRDSEPAPSEPES